MKEKDFINTIKSVLNSKYIGDDCAHLKDIGIVVSQDNLVENIHFSMDYTDAYKLGYKSAMVNISDIAASGAKPVYLSVGLSLPPNTDEKFIKEFYEGMQNADKSIDIIGGDITGSKNILVSVTAIGKCLNRKISSRKNAKPGDKIIVSGNHGSSAAGLRDLFRGHKNNLTNIHLMPEAQVEFSEKISTNIKRDYAMMDTSDGLMDALEQISQSSQVLMSIDFDKIPYDKSIEKYEDFKDLILYGGEDYQLVACVPEDFRINGYYEIGRVEKGLGIKIDNRTIKNFDNKLFNHFKE